MLGFESDKHLAKFVRNGISIVAGDGDRLFGDQKGVGRRCRFGLRDVFAWVYCARVRLRKSDTRSISRPFWGLSWYNRSRDLEQTSLSYRVPAIGVCV